MLRKFKNSTCQERETTHTASQCRVVNNQDRKSAFPARDRRESRGEPGRAPGETARLGDWSRRQRAPALAVGARKNAKGGREQGMRGGWREVERERRGRNGGSSQRCGQPSVPKWFFWFLVGSTADGRPNQREPDPGFPSFAAFCPSRVSWPVVGVRMRLARPGPAGDG